MKTLRVQFVRRTSVWVYLAGALSAALFLFAGVRLGDALDTNRRTKDVLVETALLQARVDALNGKIRLAQRTPPYQVGAAQAAREAEFPIDAVLGALEGVSVAGVRVTSLTVLPADATAQAELEYQSPEALAKYLQQLAQRQMRNEWHLVKVQSENPTAIAQSSPGQVAQFQAPIPRDGITSTATLVWGEYATPTALTPK